MAKMKLTCKKVSKGVKAAGPMKAGELLTELTVLDDGSGTLLVVGTTQANNEVDISGVATLAVVSEDTSLLTVDTPVGMKYGFKVVGPTGTTAIDHTVTWNDGSKGPFTEKLAATIKADPNSATGIGVKFG